MGKKKAEEPIRITNYEFARTDKAFREACAKARIEPTARQASKFRRRTGLAWSTVRSGNN